MAKNSGSANPEPCQFGDPRADFRISSSAGVSLGKYPSLFVMIYAKCASDRPRNIGKRFATNDPGRASY
jgi:hypothetical protein